jgi:hypothetical protein
VIVQGRDQWSHRLELLVSSKREFIDPDAEVSEDDSLETELFEIDRIRRFIEDFDTALESGPNEASWSDHLRFLKTLASTYIDGIDALLEGDYGRLRTVVVGPDGALYVVDWFNPLIGHMQYSLRDPRRDTQHGRIWRVTYRGRPLLEPLNLEGLSVGELLEQLRAYEDRTRYRARRELRERDGEEVRRELARWVEALDASDPAYEHLLLEALWVSQSRDVVDERLLRRLLQETDGRVCITDG